MSETLLRLLSRHLGLAQLLGTCCCEARRCAITRENLASHCEPLPLHVSFSRKYCVGITGVHYFAGRTEVFWKREGKVRVWRGLWTAKREEGEKLERKGRTTGGRPINAANNEFLK